MDHAVRDRVVIVTGGSRGIGRGIAEAFVAAGARTFNLDMAGPAGEQPTTAAEHVAVDVTDASSVQAAVAHVVAAAGGVDVLVNNAGINVTGRVEAVSDAQFLRALDVNTVGTWRMCQAVIPSMKARGFGRILNAASFAAIIPSVGSAAYAASKAAVVSLTRVLASELGPWNITVNAYAPGMIPTAMNGFAELDEESASGMLDMLSIRRWGTPQDVAHLLRFLASEDAGYITGALLDVSGGKFATQVPAQGYRTAPE